MYVRVSLAEGAKDSHEGGVDTQLQKRQSVDWCRGRAGVEGFCATQQPTTPHDTRIVGPRRTQHGREPRAAVTGTQRLAGTSYRRTIHSARS